MGSLSVYCQHALCSADYSGYCGKCNILKFQLNKYILYIFIYRALFVPLPPGIEH